MPTITAITSALQMARLRLRWPPASARCPVIGAIAATSKPAIAVEMPSHVLALSPPGRVSPTTPRTTYGPKTNEVITAEYADDPQSQKAQASTTRRLIRVPIVSVGPTCSAPSIRSLSVMAPRSIAGVSIYRSRFTSRDLLVGPQAAFDEHLFQGVDAVGEDPIDTGIDESLHGFGVVDGPDLDLLARPMNNLNQRRRQDSEP